jgi:hypothetical protein
MPLVGEKSNSMGSPILNQEPNLGRFAKCSFQRGKNRRISQQRLKLSESCKRKKGRGRGKNVNLMLKKRLSFKSLARQSGEGIRPDLEWDALLINLLAGASLDLS